MKNLFPTNPKGKTFQLAFRSAASLGLLFAGAVMAQEARYTELNQQIRAELAKNEGFFAVAFKDASTGRELLIHEREVFHAASTMKMPVMIEVFRQASEHRFDLNDSLLIRNEFRSIVDRSPYTLQPESDSEQTLYAVLGQKRPLRDVLYQMIIASSNLATNLIIDKVGAARVTETIRQLGAQDMVVLRGVEDSKAYSRGLNNTATAYDLMILFDKMARQEIIGASESEQMISILKDQQFNEIIPALLPPGVTVAHKTGWITGVQHDAGIVQLPDGRRYTLVLLSKNLKDEQGAIKSMAAVSRMIFDFVR
ncbi:MAG: serine hydrolase [Cytophagales bacterium]|nr:serine hydrolase [Cytophagales bacterium]